MREVDHQTQIKMSVIKQGGYSTKLSNQFTIGIPDLLIILYPFVPCLAEVKDLGEVVDNFSLKLDVSPKQDDTLKKMNAAAMGAQVAFLLVTLLWRNQRLLCALPQGTERLTAAMLAGQVRFEKRIRGHNGEMPHYNMRPLLEAACVPKLP